MKRRLGLFLGFALFLLLPTSVAAAECQFVLGFATLRDLIGHEIVGECLENEHHGANGDSLQQTTGGLLVWRKADNFTAFTDGYRSWINGPNGLVQRLNTERFPWEHYYAPGGGVVTPTPMPTPVPSPEPTPTNTAPPTPTPIQPPVPSPRTVAYVNQALAPWPSIRRDQFSVRILQRLAEASRSVFDSVLRLARINALNTAPLPHLTTIAQIDEGTALQLARMPFMRTVDQGDDMALLQYAKVLAQLDLFRLQQLLSKLKLQGGVTDDHTSTFVLSVLEHQNPELAAAIQALRWVKDGVGRRPIQGFSSSREVPEVLEETVLLSLARIASRDREVSLALARKPWVKDRVVRREYQVISNLSNIADGDTVSAMQLLGMPFLNSVTATGTESAILDALNSVLWYSPEKQMGLRDLLADPVLNGGITDDQRATVELLAIGKISPAIAAAIDTLPWVRDGIDASEQTEVAVLFEASRGTRQLLPALVQKHWVQDGLTLNEQYAIRSLVGISREIPRPDEPAALSILDMSFLDDIDKVDVKALESLWSLNRLDERDYLRHVLSHPTLRGGITDRQRARFTFLGLAVSSDPKRHFPELLEVLLDLRKSTVEERVISLPRAGEVHLAVAHTRRGRFRTMEILERVVRRQERFMLEAFPVKFVGVLAAEITPAAGGASFSGGMIAIDPGGENNTALVAHEVAHKYWERVSPWLWEGGAEVLRAVSEGVPLKVENVQLSLCHLADNLSGIDRIESKPRLDVGVDVFPYVTVDCPYVMGLGLFADLYENLGDRTFRQAFRRLYLKVRDGAHETTCVGLERAVCLVREAFEIDATPKAAAIAGPITNRWYYGSGAELRRRGR